MPDKLIPGEKKTPVYKKSGFKMKGSPMQRNFGIGSPLHDEKDKKSTYVPNESWLEKTQRKIAGQSLQQSEHNKAVNWHMMKDGPKKEYYKGKNREIYESGKEFPKGSSSQD